MVRIIDASVAVKWFFIEPGQARALEILKQVLAAPREFAVPELFYFEVVNVFHRLLPQPSPVQRGLLKSLVTFGIQRFAMTAELAMAVGPFQALGLSGYDGAYAALAKHLKGRWLTFDHVAHQRIAHLGLSEALSL